MKCIMHGLTPFFLLSILTVHVWSNSPAELFKAVSECDLEKTKALLSSGIDVDARDSNGMTPIMIASRAPWGCDLDMLKLLVEYGADVNAKTPISGSTALILANGDYEKVKYLVSKGAHINEMIKAKGMSDYNAVIDSAIYASVSNDIRCLDFLLENGGDVNVAMDDGKSLLMLLVEMTAGGEKRGIPVVKYLLEKGADINHKAKNGETSLLIAVDYENYSLTKLLLRHGAEPNCMDVSLRTPLSVAKAKNNKKLVKLLEKYRAKK